MPIETRSLQMRILLLKSIALEIKFIMMLKQQGNSGGDFIR